ncbi:site-specific integrase [Lunatibacter salilacus]|uniref:site-specific integrase n=1 Tax=Lunatibacter salilacus TaxID=2483804 RepID=UPI00131AC134|nr:site-specific integrase [Lunatibacter salilacus]
MYEEMQIRNYSPRSIENYISHVSLVSSHFGKSPDLISIAELKEYLFHKVETRNLSASSVNQTISAFKIIFTDVLGMDWDSVKIKRLKPISAVFSKEEISRILQERRRGAFRYSGIPKEKLRGRWKALRRPGKGIH